MTGLRQQRERDDGEADADDPVKKSPPEGTALAFRLTVYRPLAPARKPRASSRDASPNSFMGAT